jgi:hypothetical protein
MAVAVNCNICGASDAIRYLNWAACPEHTPAKFAGRNEPPPQDASWILTSRQTLAGAKGGSDIDKERPGGYVSRQRAQKIAATRDALRATGGTP